MFEEAVHCDCVTAGGSFQIADRRAGSCTGDELRDKIGGSEGFTKSSCGADVTLMIGKEALWTAVLHLAVHRPATRASGRPY